MKKTQILVWIFLFTLPAQADPRAQYFDALKVAEARVERTRRPPPGVHALSTSLLGQFLGRPYRVGDSWKVAVWANDSSIMRQTSEPERLKSRHGRGGIFLYEVTSVQGGTEVHLRVTELLERGAAAIDARVRAILLAVSTAGGFAQTGKKYQLAGRDFQASAEGLHAPVSYLELLPLEAPDLTTAIRSEAQAMPELPAELLELTGSASMMIDPKRSARFEQDDFFGRSIEAIWRQGDPWPVYLKTANGVAVLVSGVSR